MNQQQKSFWVLQYGFIGSLFLDAKLRLVCDRQKAKQFQSEFEANNWYENQPRKRKSPVKAIEI